jgi:hypothetical protein
LVSNVHPNPQYRTNAELIADVLTAPGERRTVNRER